VGAQSENHHKLRRLVAGFERWRAKARLLAADDKRLAKELAASKVSSSRQRRRSPRSPRFPRSLRHLVGEEGGERARGCRERRVRGAHRSGAARRRRAPPPGSEPARTDHGRRDYSALKSEEVLHDVPEHDRCCPGCGTAYEPFDEESSTEVDWQERIVAVLHRRPKYHKPCRWKEKGIVVAPVREKPIEGAVQPPVPCPADLRADAKTTSHFRVTGHLGLMV